ncbi:MAG: MerR family transcriptional regulator [Actinomycetota bacterium]|nr:MerR family transcriptional regulator [Actinomycetota bacterium]
MDNNKKYFTIGELVDYLKKTYPDISSSKLRFLESRGLLNPGRADNKYRVYDSQDIKKINFILKMQKDYYMPLDVVKEKLDTVDFSSQPDESKAIKEMQLKLGEQFEELEPKSLSLGEAADKYSISASYINELVEDSIIETKKDGERDIIASEDLEIIKIAAQLEKYGIHIKHLKMFDNFATRHASFIQQIVLPLFLSSNKESHRNGQKILNQLDSLLSNLYNLLVKRKNREFLDKHK